MSFNNYLATSKGVQPKRLINGIYHKKDYYGGEAMTEFLVSSFALACGLPYVEYKMSSSNTCVSMDFLSETKGSFLPFYNLFKSDLEFQKWYANKMRGKTPDQRLDEINKIYLTHFGINAFGYLKSMLVIDTMFRNTDRHFKNFGIVVVQNGFVVPPVFDNGLALGVGLLDDTKVKPSSILSARSKLVKMQPFGVSVSKLEGCKYFELPKVDFEYLLKLLPGRMELTSQSWLFFNLIKKYYGVDLTTRVELISLPYSKF